MWGSNVLVGVVLHVGVKCAFEGDTKGCGCTGARVGVKCHVGVKCNVGVHVGVRCSIGGKTYACGCTSARVVVARHVGVKCACGGCSSCGGKMCLWS